MGGDLPSGAAPRFMVSAAADPGTAEAPGGLLQRLQIIKGWVGDHGQLHQRIIEVAGDAASDADVDLGTCEPRGSGATSLCGTWTSLAGRLLKGLTTHAADPPPVSLGLVWG